MKKHDLFLLILGLSLSFFSPSVRADGANKGDWEVGGYAGANFLDDYGLMNPDMGIIAGARVGYHFMKYMSAEISGQRTFADSTAAGKTSLDEVRLNFLLNLMPDKYFRPFITAGGGYLMFDTKSTSAEYDYSINGGLGFRVFANKAKSAGLRFDAKYVTNKPASGLSWQKNYEATLGLFWTFGGKKTPPPDADADGIIDRQDLCPDTKPGTTVNSTGCPADTDGDGVTDDMDQCADTEAGAKVNDQGCVIVEDADGDGVTDADDKCADTPKEAKVDETGCPLDTDGDGVADYLDKCPGTEASTEVGEMGCPIQSKARGALQGVMFKSGKAELTDSSKLLLNDVAIELNEFSEVRVEVQGHSDSTGNDAFNMTLSEKRAQSVRDYLVSQGVAAERLDARGYGETKPIADNSTREGRAKNRRVELNWVD